MRPALSLCSLLALGMAILPAAARADTAAAYIATSTVDDAPQGFLDLCRRDQTLCMAGLKPVEQPAVAGEAGGKDAAYVGVPASAQTVALPILNGTAAVTTEVTVDADHGARARLAVKRYRSEARMVKTVNRVVNRSIIQVSDAAHYGIGEYWTRPDAGLHPGGDCEDLAIEKRMMLIEAGFAPDRLFYAVVYRPGLGLHTILVARLSDGDYVLDSARSDIRRWQDANYVWLRVQSTRDPMEWSRVA